MALTAISPSTYTRDPAWNQAIVPALRKRLESESHALSKRMSATSMASTEDFQTNNFASNAAAYVSREMAVTSPYYQAPKPSSIPRPSLQSSRPPEPAPAPVGRSSRSGSFQRSRTLSQPFPFDQPGASGTTPPGPEARSTSPMMSTTRTTRIPISRARTGSTSSHKQPSLNGSIHTITAESRKNSQKANGFPYQMSSEPIPDLWPVSEAYPPSSVGSRTALRTPRSQVSELVNEQPPFNANSVSSRGAGYDSDYGVPRMSTESEERPFEHWYRGDVSRNGGVGELRVGRRQEMLDIANYGHALRNASSRTALNNRSRSNSRGRDTKYDPPPHRPRAGSVGALDRESIYIDQDEQLHEGTMVLDERPLTDLDSDEDGYDDEDAEYYDDQHTERLGSFGQHDGTISPPLSLERSDTPTTLVDNTRPAFKSRIPTPTPRQISEPSRTATPTQSPTLNGADSPPTPKALPPSQTPTPKLTPNTAQGSTNKRRAKSPAASNASSTKKSRTKSPAKPQAKKKKDEARRSVAQYPAPEGDDIVHAIPSWTQPVPPSGNWDEVVLPVVARKQGLDTHYQEANGGPNYPSKPRANPIPEPAPGTFGFDHSKYRPPRNAQAEAIPLDEFGQRANTITVELEDPSAAGPQSPPAPPRSPRAESPAPFSHYNAPAPVPQIRVTRPSTEAQKVEVQMEDDDGAGCCKCVIM